MGFYWLICWRHKPQLTRQASDAQYTTYLNLSRYPIDERQKIKKFSECKHIKMKNTNCQSSEVLCFVLVPGTELALQLPLRTIGTIHSQLCCHTFVQMLSTEKHLHSPVSFCMPSVFFWGGTTTASEICFSLISNLVIGLQLTLLTFDLQLIQYLLAYNISLLVAFHSDCYTTWY